MLTYPLAPNIIPSHTPAKSNFTTKVKVRATIYPKAK